MTLPALRLDAKELIPNMDELLSKRPTQENLRAYLVDFFQAAREHLDQQPDWRIPIHPDGLPSFRFFPDLPSRTSSDRHTDKLIQRLAVYYLYTDHDHYLDQLVTLLMVRLVEQLSTFQKELLI